MHDTGARSNPGSEICSPFIAEAVKPHDPPDITGDTILTHKAMCVPHQNVAIEDITVRLLHS